MINNKLKIMCVILAFCTAIIPSFSIYAQDELIVKENAEILNDIISNDSDEQYPHYADSEIIIMLADTPETENMQFHSLYSDDYLSINQASYDKINETKNIRETFNTGNLSNIIERECYKKHFSQNRTASV